MLNNDYEFKKIKPTNELERYCQIEGLDYQYISSQMSESEKACWNISCKRGSVMDIIRQLFKPTAKISGINRLGC
jgi:hypothetical protein